MDILNILHFAWTKYFYSIHMLRRYVRVNFSKGEGVLYTHSKWLKI